jgi:hypothetical protein
MSFLTDNSKTYLRELVRQGLNDLEAFALEKVTVNNTVKTLTVPADAKVAVMSLVSTITSGPAIWVRYDADPVSGIGSPFYNTDRFNVVDAKNLTNFKVIQDSAGTHTLYVEYYR